MVVSIIKTLTPGPWRSPSAGSLILIGSLLHLLGQRGAGLHEEPVWSYVHNPVQDRTRGAGGPLYSSTGADTLIQKPKGKSSLYDGCPNTKVSTHRNMYSLPLGEDFDHTGIFPIVSISFRRDFPTPPEFICPFPLSSARTFQPYRTFSGHTGVYWLFPLRTAGLF